MSAPRVLVLHNRYRASGGEERAVELHCRALERLGLEHRLLERSSGDVSRLRAGAALLAGGESPGAVAGAVRALGATVTHVHNLQPLLGPRALAAARAAGSKVVMHLHNFRLFCAIGVAFRDGEPCFRCRRGLTLPGLALNCRGNLPEAAVYAAGLARQLGPLLELVERFVTPSRWAAGQLARLGVPAARLTVLPHYLAAEGLAPESSAANGEYALAVGRLTPEKGFEVAIDAAAASGVPLKLLGTGPLGPELRARAAGAPVSFAGEIERERLATLRAGAAFAVMPTVGNETFGYAALDAMGAGLPVIATRAGALPEVVGEQRCLPRGDTRALAAEMSRLWRHPELRRSEGEAARRRALEFSEQRYDRDLLALYDAV